MTRKTGAKAVKAKQLARAAKIIKYKQKLREAGESMSLPKPSAEAQRQKEEELKRLYLELVSKKPPEKEERQEQAEQPPEQAEQEQTEQQPEQTEGQE